jgi:hypothetical protein
MTRNQIEMIKARETERANRAKEALETRGQNINAIGSTLRGAGSFLSSLHPMTSAIHTISRLGGRQ